jgi:bla regulator protein BlaR1
LLLLAEVVSQLWRILSRLANRHSMTGKRRGAALAKSVKGEQAMTIPDGVGPNMTTALASHLWQSTAFAAVAWLLALALRNYPARVRFAVWMSASVKFLVPFVLLTSLGAHWATPNSKPQTRIAFYTMIEEFSQPFAHGHVSPAGRIVPVHSAQIYSSVFVMLASLWLCGCLVSLVRWAAQWLGARRVINDATPVDEGPEVRALRRAEAEARTRRPIPIVITSRAMEPGIFGVIRPVLLWPADLSQHLDDSQIDSIVIHELEHIRRCDNLTATVHAVIKALFWFHPAVHWMDSKMMEERERACDERVIEQHAQPEKYAESILKVCAFRLETPSPWVAGVSGSDLKKRIVRIMSHRSGITLTFGRRALLGAVAGLVLILPIGLGVLRGQSAPIGQSTGTDLDANKDIPKFDVASIKPASSADGRSMLQFTPDGTVIHGIPPQMLLRVAFGVENDRIIGAPSWVNSNRYDIEAKVSPEDAPRVDKLKVEDRRAMLLPLLVERFNLKYHHETRELAMYALVVAKGGPKITASKLESTSDSKMPPLGGVPPKGIDTRGWMRMMPGRIESQDSSVDMLAHALAPQLGRSVVDKTGLSGRYDYTLQWTPDNTPPPMPGVDGLAAHGDAGNDAPGVSLFTAIQEQLGLKLESQKGNVDVIVIDHIDPPSAN